MFQLFIQNSPKLLVLTLLFLGIGFNVFAQDGPQVDLLKLGESKPTLSTTGEGVTSYKISELYRRGKTEIVPFQPKFKVQLPIGYTLFNNLIYGVQSDAQVVGPSDIELRIPSADAPELFENLRILYAERDDADLETPKWIDGTVSKTPTGDQERYQSDSQRGRLQPNFATRTVHAYMEGEPTIFLVAIRDPKLMRELFTANLKIKGTDVEVMEGRTFRRLFRVTNDGPDTATTVTFSAEKEFDDVVSMKSTIGQCRLTDGYIFCRVPELKKGDSFDVDITEKCPWGSDEKAPPSGWRVEREASVQATEHDPNHEDNRTGAVTTVTFGTNKSPVAKVTNIKLFQLIPGPSPKIPIRVTASDPDGSISKVEALEEGELVADARLIAENQYELLYKPPTPGRHRLQVRVTDNLGRDLEVEVPEFFVNGLAEIEIVSPKRGAKLDKLTGDILITIRARNANSPLKKVTVYDWDSEATPTGNDLYTYNLKACGHHCEVQASAFDANGVETRSEPVDFILLYPPRAELSWSDGEYRKSFDDVHTFRTTEMQLLPTASPAQEADDRIVKLEVFKDGELLCSREVNDSIFASASCQWRSIRPGKYKLQTVATDEDGAVGKSPIITVTIERP